MALDYYFTTQMQDDSVPVMRFYGWDPYCLSLGRHQTSENILYEKLKNDGFDIVRRPTGGSAILHSEELTYSIIVPSNLISHHYLYSFIHLILSKTLNKLGYEVELHNEQDNSNYLKSGSATFACFNRPAYKEIKYHNRKLIGSAQKIYKDAILQHGSILIGSKQKDIIKYLYEDKEKVNKTLEYLNSNSICLNDISGSPINEKNLSQEIINTIKKSGIKIFEHENIKDIELNEAKKYIAAFKVTF